nr:immunoglobulin light chain junction region [Macaca mulatta]
DYYCSSFAGRNSFFF